MVAKFRIVQGGRAVAFACVAVEQADENLPQPANDNFCPHCGGVIAPGDKAEDCSSAGAWPLVPFPQGWGGAC